MQLGSFFFFFKDSSYGLRPEIVKGHWSGGVILILGELFWSQKIITSLSVITGLRIELAI